MIKLAFQSLLFCFLLFILACEGTTDSVNIDFKNPIYYTSFENKSDLEGWHGITENNLRNLPSPDGGEKSVFISGGCSIPHARYFLPSPGVDLPISIQFYAKNLEIGGTVELHVGAPFTNNITVNVQDTSWKFYRSKKELLWPADSTLSIYLNSGGIVASAMLVDKLQIIKTN